jgi:hypothetical protein
VAQGVRVLTDQLVTGIVVAVVTAVLTAPLTLLAQRWARKMGKVDCELYWQYTRGEGSDDSPGGHRVLERRLSVTFTNHKDVPVTVRSMEVVFYRGDKPLGERERPHTKFTRDGGTPGPFELVSLPPHVPVPRTVIVDPGFNESDRQRAVEEADRVEFVVEIEGAKTISTGLALWNDRTRPKTQRC